MRPIHLSIVALCMFLVGCDEAAIMKKMTPPGAESKAKGYVDLLQQGKLDLIERDLDPSIVDANTRESLTKMAFAFPIDVPQFVKVVGSHTVKEPDYLRTDIALEYEFPSKWLLANVAIQRKGNITTVVGFRVDPLPDSLENLNKFTLSGKSAIQYLILLLGICFDIFSIWILVLCIRTPMVKLKWLWVLITLLGVGKLTVNWSSGQLAFSLLAFQIPLCADASRPPYGPWTVSLALPLGAILFLNHRWKMKVAGEPVSPSTHNLA